MAGPQRRGTNSAVAGWLVWDGCRSHFAAELPSSGHRVPSNPQGEQEPRRNLSLLRALQVPWETTHGNTSRVIPPYHGKNEASPGQRSDVRSFRFLMALLNT